MFAINIRLKISIDLYTCFRRRLTNCVLVTYATTKRLAYGCICMLLPKHTVSSRDQSVVIGVMTAENQLYWVGVCLRERMCVTFARLVLMLTNVKLVSAVRSRPLIQVSFHVPYFNIIFWHYLCWNLIINVAKLSVCKRNSLRSQGDVTGIVGCCALAPANLLLNTMRAHSIECIQLRDIAARPKKHHLEWLRGNYSKSKPSSLYQFWSIT